MKVLVTGTLGYIGVEMVPVLRAAGHEVVGLDTGYYDECDFDSPPDEIPTLRVDLRDVTAEHCKGFDAVIHLAALSNDPLGDLNPNITYDINLHASVRLAKAAKDAGVKRFLFSSSCSLYGAGGDGHLDENAAFNPVTAYGESKVRVEQEVSKMADANFTPVYLRNATAYGVSRRLRADIVVNNLVGHAITTGKVLLQSDGTPWRPLVHIRDIIHAFACCLTAPKEAIHNQAFNVGRTGENFRIRRSPRWWPRWCRTRRWRSPRGRRPTCATTASTSRRSRPSCRASSRPGRCKKGIEELYQAYSKHHLSKEEWTGPRYYRLKTIKGLVERGILDNELHVKKARA